MFESLNLLTSHSVSFVGRTEVKPLVVLPVRLKFRHEGRWGYGARGDVLGRVVVTVVVDSFPDPSMEREDTHKVDP